MSNRKLSPLRRQALHASFGGRCFYCGVHIRCQAGQPLPRDWLLLKDHNDRVFVPDHAIPLARGGADTPENLKPSCWGCNSAKGWLTVEEYRCLRGLRRGDPCFSFPGEPTRTQRDWLCCFSKDWIRFLFLCNFPEAKDAYSRGKSIRRRQKEAAHA